jgi:hypothetical protein
VSPYLHKFGWHRQIFPNLSLPWQGSTLFDDDTDHKIYVGKVQDGVAGFEGKVAAAVIAMVEEHFDGQVQVPGGI